jgi:hypothetical protein
MYEFSPVGGRFVFAALRNMLDAAPQLLPRL